MFDQVSLDSKVAVYEQVVYLVQSAIASGRLKAGDKLPPSRTLADQLDVNVNTIIRAYRDLEVMECIVPKQGKGVFISENVQAACDHRCRTQFLRKLFEAVAEAKTAGFKTSEIDAIVSKCFASDASPYGPVPEKLVGAV